MNIGIAVHSYDAGEGTGGYVVELLPRLAAAHAVTLYATRIRATVPPGVTVVRVPAIMTRAYTAILSFPLGVRLVRRRHDVFHAQGWVAPSADVVTAHIIMAAWRAAAREARVISPVGERTLGWLVQAREAGLIGRRARHVIAPSEKVKGEIARYYGRTTGVTVVPHGFPHVTPAPDRAAARRALGLPQDALIALIVGDLRKGLDTALRALRDVPQVRLAVVTRSARGGGMDRAAALGVAERVHWIGGLAGVAPAYAAADLLVHPTIYDSFGLVVAEAMAHGIPPVVTRAAGVTELLRHGVSGWIVDGDPLAGTVAGLEALARDASLRRRLGEGARAVAASRDWDQVARETLRVYERTIAR